MMLSCRYVLCKGKAQVACRCRTLEKQYSRFAAHRLPSPCVAVVGNGNTYYPTTLTAANDEWQTPPLCLDDLWMVLCRPNGEVLAWFGDDGKWRPEMGSALCALFSPPQNVSRQTAPKRVQFASQNSKEREATDDDAATGSAPKKNDKEQNAVTIDSFVEGQKNSPHQDKQNEREQNSPQAVATATESPSGSVPAPVQILETTAPQNDDAAPDDKQETNAPKDDAQEEEQGQADADIESAPTQAATQEEDAPPDGGRDAPLAPLALVPDAYRAYFEQCPPCPALQAALTPSRFVTVQQEEFAYVLGVLYDSDGAPTHLCYGVAGSRDRPLADGEWVPTEGEDGYWLIYQPLP